jgi:hypothetical protein
MILVFLDARDLLGFEEEAIGHHFEDGAGKGEHISIGEVLMSDEDLRRAVFSGLDIFGEMLVDEAGVAEICNFEEELIVELYLHAFPV